MAFWITAPPPKKENGTSSIWGQPGRYGTKKKPVAKPLAMTDEEAYQEMLLILGRSEKPNGREKRLREWIVEKQR